MAANVAIRTQIDDLLSQTESEKKWWEKRRSQIQSDFMKEIDSPEQSPSKAASEDDAVLVDTPSKSKKKGGKK